MEFRIERAVEILHRTPGVLRTMLSGLRDQWIISNYGPDTFCPFDVVGHLIHGERTDWIPRARIILEHGEAKPFEPFDRYAQSEQNKNKSLSELLSTFESLRMENIATLKDMNLTPQDLACRGTHPKLGSVTMEGLLATWTAHDLNHIAQICKAMAHQFHDAVGPWREDMGIFKSSLPPTTNQ